MGWGDLGKPDGSVIIEDRAHDGHVGGHQCFDRETQLGPVRAFMTLRALEISSAHSRAWGPKVKWVSSVTPRILGACSTEWKAVGNGQLLSICPPQQRRTELVRLLLGLHDAGSRGQQREVVSVGRLAKVGDEAVRHKVVKEGWGDDGYFWYPYPYLVGRRVRLLVKARGPPAAEVYHKPSNQIVLESGAVDHLNEEAVRDRIKCLRDFQRCGLFFC